MRVFTCQLHLMLNAEELVLRIHTRIGAIWELGDELKARNERLIVLGELIGEESLIVRSRKRQRALVPGRGSVCLVLRGLTIAGDRDLTDVVSLAQAVRASVACELG